MPPTAPLRITVAGLFFCRPLEIAGGRFSSVPQRAAARHSCPICGDTQGIRAGRSFSEDEWRDWLREIAEKFREGIVAFSRKELGDTAARPDLTQQHVSARLSDIIDGQFAKREAGGRYCFVPDVVAHALGAALLAQLSERDDLPFDILDAELGHWLDPISGLDQRAEILRAAVSILVEQGDVPTTPRAGVLVTAWLQSQNITDSHRQELLGLASRLPDALLDAIEHSANPVQNSARTWAVDALRTIPRQIGDVFDRILHRCRVWVSVVSRGVRPSSQMTEENERHRAASFIENIGTDASGPIQVLGVNLMLVDRTDGATAKAVPALLEGFPLAHAMPVFEAATVAHAVGSRSPAWTGLGWLCVLNEVDCIATAAALRTLSAELANRKLEKNIHATVRGHTAAFLLWLIGEEADDIAAQNICPSFAGMPTYETHYLPNPSRSFLYRLERRHANETLLDVELPIGARANRTECFWSDPTFQPSIEFVTELREMSASFDGTALDRDFGHNTQGRDFKFLELALARCAPDALATIIRTKLSHIDISPAERGPRAWKAAGHFLLSGPDEAAAARHLRLSSQESHPGTELSAASQFLLLEVAAESGVRQVEILMDADLESIIIELGQVLNHQTLEESENLLFRYRGITCQQKTNLVTLLWRCPINENPVLWNWMQDIADTETGRLAGVAFRALVSHDAARFGEHLWTRGWSWSADQDFWVGHYGSDAIIAAKFDEPFEKIALRLAPWRLLTAARLRGERPEDIVHAANCINKIILFYHSDLPAPEALVKIDCTMAARMPDFLHIEPINLPTLMNASDRNDAWEQIVDTALQRIKTARTEGANFFFTTFDFEDMRLIVRHAPQMIESWLDGCHTLTAEFRRRVAGAEPAFIALCEALLHHAPHRGVVLWRVLKQVASTRYIGTAEIDDMTLMVFRVPTCAEVSTLRDELLELHHSKTDKDLLDLAIAANLHGHTDWLDQVIARDAGSLMMWRRKRAIVLSGFTARNSLPQPLAWPEGPLTSTDAELVWRAAQFRYREACARHWWRQYLIAPDRETAYAAWVLFTRSADRRAHIWMQEDQASVEAHDELWQWKMKHVAINGNALEKLTKEREEKLGEVFLNHQIQDDIGPWRTRENAIN